ncbi:MAG: hypothetical protein JST82_16940 [Bacteroidetes bacterium]|nr:hypothetical protein [Bacteroidota bacterium]
MKKLLLFFVLIGIKAEAQELEGGIGGGFSLTTTPTDNMVYKGDQNLMTYSANMRLLYTTKNNWMIGLEGQMHEMSAKSTSKKYGGFYNDYLYIDSVGGNDKKIVYAKYTVNVCAVANKRFDFGGSYLYGGIALGYVSARNNSHMYLANETYKGPDGGQGICYGLQLGYAANITDRIGIYLEGSWRSYTVDYKNADAPQVYPYTKLKYHIMAFPCTFGIRYVFKKVYPNEYGTYDKDHRRFIENKRYYNRGKKADGNW